MIAQAHSAARLLGVGGEWRTLYICELCEFVKQAPVYTDEAIFSRLTAHLLQYWLGCTTL